MANYLVTGGAGFIGSHLAEALLSRGHYVRIVDNLITGHRRNIPSGAEFVEGDLADRACAERVVQGIDYVLHQAGINSVPRSLQNPIETNRANIDATLAVLVASRDAGVKRLVFAGSSSVFGENPTLAKSEDLQTSPLSPYALQKLVAEQYCQMFSRLYGLETVTTRYFNVFGPRQDPESPYSAVIPLFIKALLRGESPTIYGDGNQTRGFTYVANIVNGVLRATETPAIAGEVFNIAARGGVSLNVLFETLRRIVGVDVEASYGPRRQGEVSHSQADISKAERVLGYSPTIGLEEGLRETVKSFTAA